MKKPKVSVVVFNYNGKGMIRDCLNSVMRQSYKNFEVIFFDNGSTDGSIKFVRKNYPRVKIIHIHPNAGVAKAQQLGYSAAKGYYIASLHIDATADRNWLKELVKVMESSESEVACAQSMVYQENGLLDGSTNLLSSNIINVYKNRTEKFYAGTAAMILKNGITKTYCDPDYFFYTEDLYLGWLLRLMGYKVVRAFKSKVDHGSGTYSAQSQKIKEKYQFLYERNRILNILSFYHTSTIIKVSPILLLNILLKTINNFRKEPWKVRVHLKSYFWIFSNLSIVMRKRKKIQSLRVVGDGEITSQLTSKLLAEQAGFAKKINKFVELYCRMVGIKTLENR